MPQKKEKKKEFYLFVFGLILYCVRTKTHLDFQ